MSKMLLLALLLSSCSSRKAPEPTTSVPADSRAHATPTSAGALPGYQLNTTGGFVWQTQAGVENVELAVAFPDKDGQPFKLVWIDKAGTWTTVADLPHTLALVTQGTACTPAPAEHCGHHAGEPGRFGLKPASLGTAAAVGKPMLVAMSDGPSGTGGFSVTWLLTWDAARKNFVLDGGALQPLGQMRPR